MASDNNFHALLEEYLKLHGEMLDEHMNNYLKNRGNPSKAKESRDKYSEESKKLLNDYVDQMMKPLCDEATQIGVDIQLAWKKYLKGQMDKISKMPNN